MRLGEILTTLDSLLKKPGWSSAKLDAKIELIRLLDVITPAMGPASMANWTSRVGTLLGLTVKEIDLLINDLDSHLGLLHKPITPLPETAPVEASYPKDGWLGKYLEYTVNNEAPTPFHFWVGVSVIGGVLARNLYFDKAHYRVYPNQFIILVAPTGRCRKSTAISIGVKLLRRLGSVNILAEKITPEALVQALGRRKSVDDGQIVEECSGFIHAPELAVFLGKQLYNEGLVALLTGLSDNPDKWDYETRTKATVRLTNVNLSMLGASTPDWLYDSIPEAAFGGGFMSRIIFVVQTETPRILPFPPPEDEIAREWLMDRLVSFRDRNGQFVNSPDGHQWYVDWYMQLGTEKKKMEDPRLAGYWERKPDHLIRLAMILAIASEGPLVLTDEVYDQALKVLNTLETPLPEAFVGVDATPFGVNAKRILMQLESEGGQISHSTVLRKNYRRMNAKQVHEVMATLKEAGMIEIMRAQTGIVYLLTRTTKDN